MATRFREAAGARAPVDEFAVIKRQIGVSRIARITGLDRTGVEVACAIRPGGHVLQVCNGKGETFEAAARGALFEAAELWAAERLDPALLTFGARRELAKRFGERAVLDAAELGSGGSLIAPELWSDEVRIGWRVAEEINSGNPLYVPAQAVHCPPADAPLLGPALIGWTTNGGAAHQTRDGARLHGLLEAIERDGLARALPRGWTAFELRRRLLDPASLRSRAPRTWARAEAIGAGGFRVFLFDLTPSRGGVRLPIAGALLFDADEGPVPLTAGYACRLDPDEALLAALFEAAQSRLTDIHGAREDVSPANHHEVREMAQLCGRGKPTRRVEEMPSASAKNLREALQITLDRLHAAGHPQVLAVPLAGEGDPLFVERVIVPGFLVSELL